MENRGTVRRSIDGHLSHANVDRHHQLRGEPYGEVTELAAQLHSS